MSEFIQVPSMGKIYDDFPKEGLSVRPWTTGEVKALYNLYGREDQSNKIYDIMQNCVENFKVRSLSQGDLDWLFCWFRIKTYNNHPLQFVFKNPSSGKDDKVTINLKSLKAMTLEDKEVTPLMELTLSSGEKVHVRYPTLEIEDHVKTYIDSLKASSKGDVYMATMALLVDEISSVEDMDEAIKLAEKKLSPDDLIMIDDHIESLRHGVITRVKIDSKDIDGNPMTYERNWALDVTNFFPFR